MKGLLFTLLGLLVVLALYFKYINPRINPPGFGFSQDDKS